MSTPVTSWEREVLASLGRNVGDSVTGGATAAKQDEIINLLIQLVNNSLSSVGTLTPELEIATTSGTIAPGAKFVSIGIKSGSGTILGTPVDTVIRTVEFPYVGVEYNAIDYTLAPDSEFIIVAGR